MEVQNCTERGTTMNREQLEKFVQQVRQHYKTEKRLIPGDGISYFFKCRRCMNGYYLDEGKNQPSYTKAIMDHTREHLKREVVR